VDRIGSDRSGSEWIGVDRVGADKKREVAGILETGKKRQDRSWIWEGSIGEHWAFTCTSASWQYGRVASILGIDEWA
jgi:hypothetical protein